MEFQPPVSKVNTNKRSNDGLNAHAGSGMPALHPNQNQRILGNQAFARLFSHQTLAKTPDINAGSDRKIMRSTDDPAEDALFPNVDEQGQISEILDPQHSASAQTGSTVPPVNNPAVFRQSMKQRMSQYINLVLPNAQARKNSPVALSLSNVKSIGNVAQQQSTQFYGTYLRAAVHSPQERQKRANLKIRDRLHLVSEKSPQARLIACNWVASRMALRGNDIIKNHNVRANVISAKQVCFPGQQVTTGTGNTRDQALFNSTRDEILNDRLADLRTIMIYQASFAEGDKAFIQSHVAPQSHESQQQTRRRGRWKTLGTVIHEMMHLHAHEKFSDAAETIEEAGIAVEGFAEYFARPVYNALRTRAQTDNTLRESIEGVQQPFDSSIAEDRSGGGYQPLVDEVNKIKRILGGNEESLKAAFFLGRVEFIGLGGWNAQEANRRNDLRYPGNQLGVAALIELDDGSIANAKSFRIRYGRVIYGRSGPFQITLGGNINYLSSGSRIGIGGSVGLLYNWPNVFVRAGIDAGVSTAAGQSVRLDAMPGIEAGFHVGVARIGIGATMLIPLKGGPVDEKVIRVLPSVGARFVF